MPNPKTDPGGFSTSNADQERDLGARGGPSTSLGIPDDKHGISAPYDSDLQTQIVAKGKSKKKRQEQEDKRDDSPENRPENRTSL